MGYRAAARGDKSLMTRAFFAALTVVVAVLLAGCMEQDNLLENSSFSKWKDTPEGWSIEGDATVKKAGENGIELYAKPGGSPFLYQRIKPGRGSLGRLITLAAWVKADLPGSAVIEYSDRKGNDLSSAPHPGDGQWHLLKVEVRIPEALDGFEIRIRERRPGVVIAKDPMVTARAVMSDAEGAVPGYDLSGAYRTAGAAVLLAFIGAAVVFFRRREDSASTRLLRSFILLVLLSDIMLVLNRPLNSEVTSNIAWAVFIIFAVRLALPLLSAGQRRIWGKLARPRVVLIMLSVFFAALSVYALGSGAMAEAEKDAKSAFAAMVAGAAVIALARLVPKKSANMEVLARLREKGAAGDAAAVTGVAARRQSITNHGGIEYEDSPYKAKLPQSSYNAATRHGIHIVVPEGQRVQDLDN